MQTSIKKIAIFRALQLGDMLCSVPAFRALRTAFPEAHITLLGLPWAASFAERFHHYLDEFVHFPGYPGLPEQPVVPKQVPPFLMAMQERQFDLILQMQGNGSIVNPMVALLGGQYTAGYWRREDGCPDAGLFLEYPEQVSEIERHLQLMEYLDIPLQGTHLEFPITAKDVEAFNQLCLPLEAQEYLCVHPGSRGSWRQWPPHMFAAMADEFAEKGWKIVLTGTKDERPLTEEVAGLMKHKSINTAGLTTLGSLGVLIKNARALLSNCTGVSHMAAAFETPSVIISMDGEPARWAPLNKQLHYTIDWTTDPDYEIVLRQGIRLLETTGRGAAHGQHR
ncbi:ADP-heptose:LPS heptosyltransferase [Chitinophaga sp. YR627]|uniref:glycosyltransferase family 9 protein n=1 Tax=Chitinophaga sp. YR627 TaxID=1881041 RepID=UPI0008F01B32|nr:glycosyltransferase family 9 protein [Chitinophaga sp. YR627]SFM65922.1 ADP-heptose:LPS heptosyltransferase [Chitinophaga sp. YR627]